MYSSSRCFFAVSLIVVILIFLPGSVYCQNVEPLIRQGLEQYKQENYEEAIDILVEARKQDPESSTAAFFLGLAYKQVMDYPRALEHLQDAVTLTPKIKEAVVELIDISLQLEKIEEAGKWIQTAEEEEIFPARTAFLKGMLFQKQGKNLEAIESFENAVSLDKALTQSAEFQIAICYMKEKKLKAARDRFRAAVLFDPQSDLGSFARQYQDMVEKRIFLERPFRFTFGLFGQYDTNMVLKPTESAIEVTDEESYVMNTTFRANYVPILKGPWLFNARYSFISSLHQKNTHSHDFIGNSVSVCPGYNFGRFALNLTATYSSTMVRDESYKRYVDSLSVGPLLRALLNQNHILEVFAGYNRNEYFKPSLTPEEDRDSNGLSTYISWVWLFKNNAFFNLKYEFIDQNADGINWENNAHKFSLNISKPIFDKVSLQVSGQAYLQDFKYINTTFNTKREDNIYTGSIGFTWEFIEHSNLVVQYSKTRADSNIGVYDYKRDLYTAGVEYRF
ncbi:MAG: hypothetical protein SRB1_02520 [Desulfobacteraceae bacterium Eth-SRB1]|nr:MAG: hypothetical protein SRB1_02520 [Desulfobacteraceae bacterium Eth-SRB1]